VSEPGAKAESLQTEEKKRRPRPIVMGLHQNEMKIGREKSERRSRKGGDSIANTVKRGSFAHMFTRNVVASGIAERSQERKSIVYHNYGKQTFISDALYAGHTLQENEIVIDRPGR